MSCDLTSLFLPKTLRHDVFDLVTIVHVIPNSDFAIGYWRTLDAAAGYGAAIFHVRNNVFADPVSELIANILVDEHHCRAVKAFHAAAQKVNGIKYIRHFYEAGLAEAKAAYEGINP